MLIKPLALLDLDDTLFQTDKHLPKSLLKHVATLDKYGAPLSFMTDIQLHFWQWLNASAEVIPVTARSVEGLKRVQMSFTSWQVCQHGAVILNAQGEQDEGWARHMQTELASYQVLLHEFSAQIAYDVQQFNDGRVWVAQEFDQSIYIIVKKSTNNKILFKRLVEQLRNSKHANDFYIHINGNTMAILPCAVTKSSAVSYLLTQIQPITPRPILGWGDSLSDLPFLQHCDWWGVPRASQVSSWTDHQLQRYIEEEGAYEHTQSDD